MKRFCVLLSILAILNMGVSIADAQRWIPDTNLRAAVRDALDLADGDRLTKAAIRDMTELSASRSQISDLTGLEFATNVIVLKLNGNSISDLSPLSGLENLTSLHIWSNDITDLSPLADMTQLEVLRFTKNSVSDLSALAGLVNLKRLSLKSNNVSDVSPLSGLESLEILHLTGNRITNTSVLAGLVSNLTQPLDIIVFPDRNLEVLVREALRNSEGLADDEMLTPEFMALLTRVEAHTGTPVIRSLSGLEHATNLKNLIFGNTENATRDLTPLAGLAHLTRVELEGRSIALETLLTLPSLSTLRLRYASLTDLTTVSELTGVRTLQLNFNGNLRDLTPLAGMENLRRLTVNGSYRSSSDPWNLTAADALSDISPLSALENLTYLSLDYNGISDLSALSALANLEELFLKHNNISDVSPLVGLTGLTKLRLLGNPVANASALYPLTQQDTPVDIDIDVPEPVVEVPDAALASVLRTTLELAEDADITESDMVELTSLDASSQGITDLTGLEYATNLTELVLDENTGLGDVSKLSGLTNLTSLALKNTGLTDISPLADLTALTGLALSSNSIVNITSLQDLVNLEYLYLRSNEIVDISLLASLTNLKELSLGSNNDISDVSALVGLVNLEFLQLADNNISDITSLAGLVRLGELDLADNAISDVSALSGLVNLLSLTLTNNSIVDVSPLANLVGLETLFISGNPVADTSPLEYISAVLDIEVDRSVNMPDAVLAAKVRKTLGLEADAPITKPDLQNLTELRYELFYGAPALSSVSGLEHARNLILLQCEGATIVSGAPGITDITPLTGLVKLEKLFLDYNTINDFTPLAGLTNLRTLTLEANHISDISGLSGLTSLELLSLDVNDISDVSPLGSLTNLNQLFLASNNIRDITPLEPLLPNLRYLYLGFNPLMDTRTLLPSVFDGRLDITPSRYPSWDVNRDGAIDEVDVTLVTGDLGQEAEQFDPDESDSIVYGTRLATDVNHDGIVDNADIAIVQSHIASDTTRADALVINLSVDLEVEIALASPGMKTGPFDITITFSDAVTGFHRSDVSFASLAVTAEITAWDTQDNITYTATVTPTISETRISETLFSESLFIRIRAGVAVDAENNLNIATVSTQVRIVGGDIVEFTDVNLAAAIRDSLSVAANQNITTDLLGFVSQLTANNLQISDLTGLEHATSLRQLSLNDNSINDVLPLGSLTSLTSLRLDDNDIVNISSLGSLTRLTVASFAGNEIVDIPSLEEWSRISILDLRDNNITDVSPLEDVTSLTSLMLTGNPILDTSPLYPLTQRSSAVAIDIAVSQYAPWDVNEDGNVDATDTALVTAAIGQSGASIVNSRTDVDGDDDVDNDDLLLVTGNFDGANGAAPTALGGIVNLVDATALESLDRDVLQAQLQILRTESDGSVKYRNAIALLEAFLVATRPEETMLLANYPNPFNPETWIPYHLADASNVRITVYDTRGIVVRRLDLGHQREGYYTSRSRAAYWDGRNHVGERVASGIYFYQLEADDVSRLRKMVILK